MNRTNPTPFPLPLPLPLSLSLSLARSDILNGTLLTRDTRPGLAARPSNPFTSACQDLKVVMSSERFDGLICQWEIGFGSGERVNAKRYKKIYTRYRRASSIA